MIAISFIIAFVIFFCFAGQCLASPNQFKVKRLDGSTISSNEIERAIAALMNAARVTGLGVAIINDSKVVYSFPKRA